MCFCDELNRTIQCYHLRVAIECVWCDCSVLGMESVRNIRKIGACKSEIELTLFEVK